MEAPRPASTVILARPVGRQYEVFMVRRPTGAATFADAFVFPGGGVRSDDGVHDPVDGAFRGAQALRILGERGGIPPSGEAEALGYFRAALRELFEEAGVLLARDRNGPLIAIPPEAGPAWEDLRRGVQAKAIRFIDLLADLDLTLDHLSLTYFSHWITPRSEPRRFDTRFFVALMPDRQVAAHCAVETIDGAWIAPGMALARFAAGQFPLFLPTRLHLEVLAAHRTIDDLAWFARTKPIRTVRPERAPLRGENAISLGIEEGECW